MATYEEVEAICRDIAFDAHEGQFRHDGFTRYITHPAAVVTAMDQVSNITDEYRCYTKCIAWLHDVLEDSDYTTEDLMRAGVPEVVIEAVELLTRVEGEPYLTYLLCLKETSTLASSLAQIVKIADIRHNISTLAPGRKHQREKYLLALHILGDDVSDLINTPAKGPQGLVQ